ncbi:MAG: carboxy terminal-processing peptidase [Bacteroidota bacterium]
MKGKILISSAIVAALFLLSSYTVSHHYEGEKGAVLLNLMMRGMTYYHYQPQQVDDEFSQEVFNAYLERIDYNKRFLTQRDVDNLRKFQYRIDDEVENSTFELFDLSYGILQHRIEQAQGYTEEILSEPFNFEKSEKLDGDFENLPYANSESEIKERWRKSLKYQVLTRLSTKLDRQEEAMAEGNKEIEIKSKAVLEEEARTKVAKTYKDYFKRLSRLDKNDRRADYMNAIAAIYDPHTNYFPPKDKENFDISMSGRLEGIGAQLREEDGYIKVIRIVPGSPSAKQGGLQINDKILKVTQYGEEPVSVIDMDIDDAVKMIRGPKGSKVILSVRKIDGMEMDIPIVRDVVELQETYAKSAILKDGDDGDAIGYIHLPKFYADFNRRNGRRCAVDVANEVKKLKKEGVESIILDLRDNGGGSLQDVVDMAGLFIESGPIVQVKSRKGSPRKLSDRDPGILYDGELIVMVNSFSASASEIMAAAIQDYDRGIIVGSPSTFGKGTVQRFVNLDDLIQGRSEIKPLGEMKLTTQKFYRINGGTTQLRGVIPDIILPDEYSLLEMGEKDQDHPMQWDEIASVPYKKWENPVSDELEILRANSEARVKDNPTFQLIQENAHRFKRRRDQNIFELNIEDYKQEKITLDEEAEKYKDIRKEIESLQIQTLQADMAEIQSDSLKQKRIKTWHKNLKKDLYVYEVMQIAKDMGQQ